MLLKSLEMQGFKSFPDKTSLEFGQGITAVVGPNGSGKSNISDAVRWVLGEQSSKSLRGSKMEDVVFGGTSARRAQGFAEVTLTLDNSDRTLPCEQDEVRITRRYYRSGESEYKLNRAAVRLKDIHELFMDTGLGRDGYSIVGQGRIADIISSKSDERREIFEEAAGISRYRYRRNDATRRLTQAQENLIRLKDIEAELEGRIEPLREQSEKAQQYVVLAEEQKQLQIGLWMHSLEKSKNVLREQDKKLSYARGQYAETERILEETERETERVLALSQEKTARLDEIQRRAAEIEEEILRIQGQIQVLENTILHNKDTIERITRDKEQAQDTQRHLKEEIDEKETASRSLNERLTQQTREYEEVQAKLAALRDKLAQSAQEADVLAAEKNRMIARAADLRVEASTSASSIQEVRARLQTIDETSAQRQAEAETARKRKQESEENLKFCKERLEESRNEISLSQQRAASCSRKLEECKAENARLSLQVQQKMQRAKMLSDMEKNLEGYAGSVKAVMQEARRGGLKGIMGPVSQLISVPERFTVAVETALGGALQHIVAENETDGKEAISFLKNHRAGRATFLPLNSVRGTELNDGTLTACRGFICLGSNAVTYDPKYAGVIKSLLGRTAVVESIDDAIAIARQFGYKFRIVTLDGQVLNAGGSMTGGSQVKNAGMLSRANEIQKMQQQGAELKARFDEGEKNRVKLGEELSAANAAVEKARARLTKIQEDLIREQGEFRILSGELEAAEKFAATLGEEKTAALARLETLSGAQEKAGAALEDLTVKQTNAQKRLAGLTELKQSLEVESAEFTRRSGEISLELLSVKKDIESCRESLESLYRRRSSHSGRVGQIDEEIREIEDNSKKLEAQIAEMRLMIQKSRESGEKNRTEAEAIRGERETLEQKQAQLRIREREHTAQRERLGGELARLEEKRAAGQKEFEEIISRLYDDYQLTRSEAEAVAVIPEDPAQAQKRLAAVKSSIKRLGVVNVAAIEEYKEVSERYEFLSGQIADIEKARDELQKMIEDLTGRMRRQFQEQFVKINERFGETFTQLFGGGKAMLSFENPADILESGIEIRVQPPGKNVQNIDLFSGGEKALVAIALLFAILKVTPAPFCIFDEVEAALDDVNVERFAQYMRQMTEKTQFIAITHRRGTMEEADVLYGVTMQEEGVSKLLELKTAEMAQKLGI